MVNVETKIDNRTSEISHKIAALYKDCFGDDLIAIYVYGSRVRGDYTDDSDLDIAAIVRGDRRTLQDKLWTILSESNRIGLEYDMLISPTVIPYDEFEMWQHILPYYRNIHDQGVEIVA